MDFGLGLTLWRSVGLWTLDTQGEAEDATAALHASLAASVPALLRRTSPTPSRSPTPSLTPTDDAQAALSRSMDELRDAEDATDALHRMLSNNLPSCACALRPSLPPSDPLKTATATSQLEGLGSSAHNLCLRCVLGRVNRLPYSTLYC